MKTHTYKLNRPEDSIIEKNPRVKAEGAWAGASWDGCLNPQMARWKEETANRRWLVYRIDDYDPQWAWRARLEKERIRKYFSDKNLIVEVQHTGSTSIPGCAAKPIIDLMVGLTTLESIEETKEHFKKLGYLFITPCKWGCFMGRKLQTPNPLWISICLTLFGDFFWRARLLFRDFMRDNPEEVAKYVSLKRSLKEKNLLFSEYCYGKVDYINSVLIKAGMEEKEASRLKVKPLGVINPLQLNNPNIDYSFSLEACYENH